MAPKASKNKEEDEYKLPDKIPEGTILTTIAKKQFRVGKSIGKYKISSMVFFNVFGLD